MSEVPGLGRPLSLSALARERPVLEPYQALFPIGFASGLIGVGLWPLAWLRGGDPSVAHRGTMMLGFEMSFVLGFLLTAMPAFTRGAKCRPWELAIAVTAQLVCVSSLIAGSEPAAEIAALVALLLAGLALVRRVAASRALPPEEFVFVAFALVAGIGGAALRLALAVGAPVSLPLRFADRLTSLGMILPLVLGLGSLLVPTFAGIRDPLTIPGIAGPHERRGRRLLYGVLVLALAGSLAADLAAYPGLASWLRAAVTGIVVLAVWKLYRPPGNAGAPAQALRVSGAMLALGMFAVALAPTHTVALLHIVFIGGFALLTLGIGTRVLVSHGHHPLALERAALTPFVMAALAFALFARLGAEWNPGQAPGWLAASGGAWWLAWGAWGVRAVRTLGSVHRSGA